MKQKIRYNMLKARMELADIEWEQKSEAIFKNICQINELAYSTNIMAFMNFKREVSTKKIVDWLLQQQKEVIIPRVIKNNPILELCKIQDYTDMHISSLGIREPKITNTNFANPRDIEVVIIPGVAFSENGDRLGYGGGYYDRLIPLMTKHPLIIAPSFELQLVKALPTQKHDIKVDMIITESRIIKCTK